MSWIILEGLDKTGKSTVAELYKKRGYDVYHMSAPDKKYIQEGYSGPSYLDELVEIYLKYDNKNVVFDRSPYGELVWPQVYGRNPALSDDDIDFLKEFEDRNQVQRILMIDPNTQGHWERCVANNEPLNQHQFKVASSLFNKLAHQYNFIPQQLSDFDDRYSNTERKDNSSAQEERLNKTREDAVSLASISITTNNDTSKDKVEVQEEENISEEQAKLEKANAINSILSKRVIKQRGVIFDRLEKDIKSFLQEQLSELLGSNSKTNKLTVEEVQILKLYCQRIKEKARGQND